MLFSLLTVGGWKDAGAWGLGRRAGRSEFRELAGHLSSLAQHLKLSLGGYTGHPGSSQVKQVENEVVTGVQYCSRVVAHKDVRDTGIEILVILT